MSGQLGAWVPPSPSAALSPALPSSGNIHASVHSGTGHPYVWGRSARTPGGIWAGPALRVSKTQVGGVRGGFPRKLTLKLGPEAT